MLNKHHFGLIPILLVFILMSPLAQAATDCAAVTEIPSTECEALIALYNSTDGANWGDNHGWNETNTPCSSWYGVSCSEGHVSKLDLSDSQHNNQVTGEIPTELGNLIKLYYLDLSSKALTGEIPTELGNLIKLYYLDLSSNALTGEIPTELSNLSNLETINLSSNQLTGEIPTELSNLSNLRYLYLSNNQLTGEIPTELGNLTNLWRIALSNNQLTGLIPRELGNLTHLTSLDLSNNQLTSPIPSGLGNLTHLTTLDLSNNQLTGLIPSELGNLSNLKILYLDSNQLCGEIPISLQNLIINEYLKYIDINIYNDGINYLHVKLDNNHLSIADLEMIYWLDHGLILAPEGIETQTPCPITILQFLPTTYSVTENGGIVTITVSRVGPNNGAISANYATTNGTATADNDYIQTTGTLSWADGDSTNKSFTITIIDDDQFEIPETFSITLIDPISGENLDIAIVSINDNDPFDCAIVTEIPTTECEALITLYNNTGGANWERNDGWDVTNMLCSWDGISCQEGQVSQIRLENNQLTGEIPTELGNLSNLETINLSSNQLTGEIPTELGNLSNLETINLSSNQLTGEIPTELGNLNHLQEINLSSNQLTGEIPRELGNLKSLRLNNNQLSGEIPTGLSKLSGLWLNNNQLCGEIPVELKNLRSISTNHLTTSDLELIKHLNRVDPNWKHTQTSCSTASVRFSSTTYSLGGKNGRITVSVTRAGNEAISANYNYKQTTGTLSWADGDLADKTIPITIIDDGKSEDIEIFTITLSSPVNGKILDNATIIINNLFDCTTVTEIPIQECQALIALYDSTGGANWYKWDGPSSYTASPDRPLGWIDTYMPLDNPCQWEGVKCSGGHITALELAFTNLVGSIPAELGNLSHLKTLQLGSTYGAPISEILESIEDYCGGDVFCLKISGRILYDHIQTTENHLSGPIPPELGNLSQLETLQLGVGNLSGPIPPELGNLSQLKTLELHYNSLCGVIPAELKKLSSLTQLNIGNNHLSSSDPDIMALLDYTQTSCSPQIDLEKDSYNPGELFQARLTEELTSGYDLYAAVVMPDGNFFALTKENEFVAANTVAKWYEHRIADSPVMLLDLILPDNLPSGEYCLYGILSPENKPVLESVDLWVWTVRCLFIN